MERMKEGGRGREGEGYGRGKTREVGGKVKGGRKGGTEGGSKKVKHQKFQGTQ